MSKAQRGKRDGGGPYKESFQRQNANVGKRQQAGEPCPKKPPLEPTGLGKWADKRRHID